ncbi:GILT-like protein 1 [Cimex lectularius]|uniref:Gamma-interferon inducible lysosomal thiol reductase n=1 Tax=Cimex lectularius TaxID=79782 RepID=A0A8I6RIA1_CIMLE|nr:GILT-like protein 1 [Cimex lectularius]
MYSLMLLFVLATSAFAQHQKVMVEVFYESLCPDSKTFVTEQLAPTWKNTELQSYLNVSLVPYGKSKTSGVSPNFTFECHHGAGECLGNKYHACAIKKVGDLTKVVPYVSCFMLNSPSGTTNFTEVNKKCGKEAGLTDEVVNTLEQCSNSTDGSMFLEEFGNMTMKFENPLTSVPTVRVDGTKITELNNLKGKVCEKLAKQNLATCTSKSDAPVHSAMSAIILVFAVVLTRL